MSHINPGLLSTYNSLTDKHLSGYFSNTRIRRHLQRAGLITRSGRIVPDKEYKHKLIQRAHQRHVRESLAQAIFHKVLEMEVNCGKRETKKTCETDLVWKVERSKRYEEAMIRILSPRPPTRARDLHKQHSGPEEEHSESSESSSSTRPNTAPGKMQRPVRLKPIHSNSTTASLRRSSPYRPHESPPEDEQLFDSASHCTYGLPVINNFVTPVPPVTKKKERGVKVTPSSTVRGRRLRPTTSSSGADVSGPFMSSCAFFATKTKISMNVNMVYFGKTVHLTNTLMDLKDEVRVFQQHCGGENLCVYKGNLYEGEMFQFISRRHRGFPFSLTFYLNGLQVERLSSCCEFKHRKGPRLGGRHGHFGFSSVEGASPLKQEGEDEQPQPPDNSQSNKDERVSQVEGDEKAAEDEVTAEGGKSKEPGEARLHVDDENVARDDKTEEPFDGSKPADAESSENDEERVEKVVVLADVHTDGTGQRAKGEEEDESSVLEPSKETDETAEAENAEAEATAASETTEIKAESSEEREALSCEEAPETDAGRRQQADSEDSTAASDAEVTAGNSSGLPGEAADATGERTATKSEEAMNGKGDEDEMEEEAEEDTPETGDHEQEKCELQEEKMEISAEVHDNTEKQTSEEEEQSHLKSEEITEDETLQETEQSKTEEITDERKVDESTDKNENTTENEEEAAKPLDEQNKAVNIENTEEQEKAESPEVSERVEGQRGEKEPEAEGDENSHENVKIIETNVDPEEKDEGAGKTEEAENEDKVTKSEKYGERKDVTEDAPREGEEMSEITEEKEKSEDMDTKKTKICANNIAESEDACDGEAADETKTAEKVQNITDSESDKWKTAGACENEDIDAENGEISFAAESNANKDEEGAPAKEKVGSETAEEVEEEDRKKAEEAAEEESTEVKESREAAAKHEGNVFGAAPDAELTESDAKEGDDGVAKHGESTKEGPELTSDPETKEDPKLDENKGNEETREDENGKKSDLDHQNEALNLIRNDNIERNFSEVALSEGQEKSSSPADDAVKQLGEEKAESAAAVGAELSAADGENGEGAEEASKASEEGASVLLKPSTRNSVAEQSVTVREDTPGALANGDNTDLVTNWINMHQSSRYFETFVEPLEDLREDVFDVKVSNSDREDRPPTELPTSEMRRVIGDDEESRDKTQTETKNLEHLQDDRYDPAKGEEKAEVNLLASSKKTDQSGHGGAVEEERAQAGAVKETHEESRFSKSEVESFSVSLKAESVFENQSGEKVTNIGSDLSAKEASADLSLKTKELRQSESPGVLSDAGEADNQMRQVTQRATIDGSHEEPRGEDAWSEMFEESFGGETRDMQLIQDITQTFSKDHLSSFSVDRAPFGHTSYPLLTTSSAESGQ
uniref:Glutamate rich 3 n=1 Tax=Kryptolebias marmoratus TaxID=37003 RepID=A0A3Q2ZID3_KRYMA